MTRVTIRVETDYGDTEVSEQNVWTKWGGEETPRLEVLLDMAMTKVRRAYDLVDQDTPAIDGGGVTLSDTNRYLIYRAFDDGMGTPFAIEPSDEPEYFRFMFDGNEVMKGTEVNGNLYCILPMSGGGFMSVLTGQELSDGISHGVTFDSEVEARNFIAETTAT